MTLPEKIPSYGPEYKKRRRRYNIYFNIMAKVFVFFTVVSTLVFAFSETAISQVTTYQPPVTTYTIPGDTTYNQNGQTFNTDQIYNPLTGGSSTGITAIPQPYIAPVQDEAAPDYSFKKKLPIIVTGDYVEYRTAEEKVIAKGAADVKQDKMEIIANNIEADLNKELVFAQGKVVYWQEQSGKLKKVTGEFLVYNIKTGDGFMLDAKIYSDPTITKAKRVELTANKISAPNGATYTSCDLDHPHWCMQASEVTIYPNDRMILKRPRYNLFGITIFKLPYASMNLRKKEEKKFKMTMGYTKPKGFYQNITWDYFFNDNQNGSLSISNETNRGYFQNINHRYKFMDKISGTLYSDYSFDSIRNESINRNSLTGQYQIKNNSTLNYNIDYFSDVINGNYTVNKEMNSQYNLSYNEQDYDFLVRYKKRTDLNDRPNQYVSSLDYTPEIDVNTRREKIINSPLFLSTRSVLGTREETTSGNVLRRNVFDTQWRVDTERFQLSQLTNLTVDSSYRLRADKADERENILDGGVTMTQNIGKYTNANLRYNNTRTYGIYPFQSNRIDTQNKLYSTLAYSGPTVTDQGTELRSNLMQFYYDYDLHAFQGVSNDFTMTYKKDKFTYHRLYLRASYDYQDTMFSNLFSGNMNLSNLYLKYDYQMGEKINWQTSTTYDRITKQYQTMNSTIQFDAGRFWRVNADVIYDLPTKSLSNVNYYFIRDLHCMEATIRANPQQKEYYIEFGIKAFPEDRQRGYYDKVSGKFKRTNTTDRLFY